MKRSGIFSPLALKTSDQTKISLIKCCYKPLSRSDKMLITSSFIGHRDHRESFPPPSSLWSAGDPAGFSFGLPGVMGEPRVVAGGGPHFAKCKSGPAAAMTPV